ncbi:hypothetical protein LSTR_LSTR005081 [Laodelphax striatellus]|uniref:Uncharacterized protein n=1 Tax=Laodelphax striatellus TaxID=195883 RepID=A0A482WTH6_LAOST|nr:hypothetical protein LSTR_LSTR005081 [Laodelphax striatellus]
MRRCGGGLDRLFTSFCSVLLWRCRGSYLPVITHRAFRQSRDVFSYRRQSWLRRNFSKTAATEDRAVWITSARLNT